MSRGAMSVRVRFNAALVGGGGPDLSLGLSDIIVEKRRSESVAKVSGVPSPIVVSDSGGTESVSSCS